MADISRAYLSRRHAPARLWMPMVHARFQRQPLLALPPPDSCEAAGAAETPLVEDA